MTSRRIKSVLIGGLFSAFVPIAAYLYLRMHGHDGHIKLPKVYGIDRIDTVQREGQTAYDTTWHTCSNLKLINQLGDTVGLNETYAGKILVVNFFFTQCQTICPVQSKNMKLLNKAFKKNDTSVRFISMTVDPVNDSVPVLRAYADRYEANHDKWNFVTAPKDVIYNFARQELFLNLPLTDSSKNDFIHPEQFVLIDKYRNIRGYYNGLDSNDVRRCAEDIAYLMVEKNRLHEKRKH
ncbi:MAG: SCO family protein [Chitinophagaceae bacterium]